MSHPTLWASLAAALVVIVQIVISWRLLQFARGITRYEEKLGHLADAISLLTETTEAGFRATAAELERLGGAAVTKRAARPGQRMTAAARRGRSVQEIAVKEGVSEGEVRLRLHLAEQARTGRVHDRPARPRGKKDASEMEDLQIS